VTDYCFPDRISTLTIRGNDTRSIAADFSDISAALAEVSAGVPAPGSCYCESSSTLDRLGLERSEWIRFRAAVAPLAHLYAYLLASNFLVPIEQR